MVMKFKILLITLFLSYGLNAQTPQQLKKAAATFSAMPEKAFDLIPYIPSNNLPPVIASGSPINDLEWTMFDSDYIDGETDGYDVFYPVDPGDQFPGSNRVKMIECASKIHTSEQYSGANGDRIILGIAALSYPFFTKGTDNIDNDFCIIQHFDYRNGHIQLNGSASDYGLVFADKTIDSVATTGYYLFYTANGNMDLIAFIFPCNKLFGDQNPSFTNAFCNSTNSLSLTNPNQFKYAKPISNSPSIPNGIAQVGTNGKDVVSRITVDYKGNIYLFGLTDGNFDNGLEATNELFVSKTSPEGKLLWVAELPASEGSMLFDAETDSNFVYAVGRTYGSLPGFQNKGKWDGVILKIDINNGTIVNIEQFGTSVIDGFGNIELDDNGNLYVSGAGSSLNTTGLGDPNFILAKYNKNTLNQIWLAAEPVLPNSNRSTEAWGGITYIPSSIPGQGKIVVGGWFANNTVGTAGSDGFLCLFTNLNASYPTKSNCTVVSSNGFNADWVWGNTADTAGNIYAVGYTTGNMQGTNKGNGDAYIVKYDSNLSNPIFKQIGTPLAESFREINIDSQGNIFVSGFTYGNWVGNNQDSSNLSADVIIQKYDANLNLLAQKQFGTPSEERGFLKVKDNYIFVGGMTEGCMASKNQGSFDGYILALNASDLSFTNKLISSVSQNDMNEVINYFPNPTTGLLTFNLKNDQKFYYSIINQFGQQLSKGNIDFSASTISLEQLTNGVYFIQLQSDNFNKTIKVIKK
jgi:Secretion system C-terminal sorting domain/Beta-propeller repeat